MNNRQLGAWIAVVLLFATSAPAAARERMTKQEAAQWYRAQPWLMGSNYVPSTAINQLEMWQAPTFDPVTIDREFGWAEKLGMNTMRVFLHNLLWEQDAEGFRQRVDQMLAIAAKHHIRVMLVLFDSVWDPDPKSGPQHPPIPGVFMSGWVEGPGAARLADRSQDGKLQAYVEDVVGHFGKDDRVLAWDVWNEPDHNGGGNYRKTPRKTELVASLLPRVFEWARARNPVQPITSGLHRGPGSWAQEDQLNAVEKVQLAQSDILSFHDYGWPEVFEGRIRQLLPYGRPILCTEWLARLRGSTVDTILPLGKRYGVGMYNWGFVDGKTATKLPPDSWSRPMTSGEPDVWYHDLLHSDGTPFRQREAQMMRELTDQRRP